MPLLALLADEHSWVRHNAVSTLARIGPAAREAVPTLATQKEATPAFRPSPERGRKMFVGEAPGRDEDRQGVPFVGRAGQLLTKIISIVALVFKRKSHPSPSNVIIKRVIF